MINSNTKAIIYLELCLVSFLVGDILLKILFDSVPTGQIVWFRTIASIACLFIFIAGTGRIHLLKTRNPGQHALRGIFFAIISIGYYLAIKNFPLSAVAAALAGAPILISVISPFILKEKANVAQWIATLTGFIGVCLVLKLKISDFSLLYLSLLSLPFAYTVLILWGRKLSKTDSDWAINFYQFIPLLIISSFWGFDQWIYVSKIQFINLMISGVAGAIGFMFLIAAFRLAKPVIIAPFEYTYILMALTIDIIFWDLMPDNFIRTGVTLILICGIIQWWQSTLDETERIKDS
jgi:drug/metabolite transporter (DMT)-like permease